MPEVDRMRRLPGWGPLSLMLGGLGACFAVAACCALPLLLGGLGLGTAWLFGVAKLAAPHRTAVLIVGAGLLMGGAIALWNQTHTVCPADGWCGRRIVRISVAIGLALGLALLVLGYRYA